MNTPSHPLLPSWRTEVLQGLTLLGFRDWMVERADAWMASIPAVKTVTVQEFQPVVGRAGS